MMLFLFCSLLVFQLIVEYISILILIYFILFLKMNRDWNDVKDSEDDQDSWDDDQKTPPVQQDKKQSQQKSQIETSKEKTQHKQSQKQQKEKPKFLKDQEILQQIKNKTIQQRKKLKLVNCVNQDVQAIVKSHKLISYLKQIRNGLFMACFKTEEDTIAFIQQKIQKRYRFFIHQYIKTAKDIEKQKQREQKRLQRQKERNSQKEKGYYNNNRDKDFEKNKVYKPKYQTEQSHQSKYNKEKKELTKQNRNRPQYQQEDSEEEKPKKYQNKTKNNHEHEHPHNEKKVQKQKPLNFQIKDNYIRIKSNQYSKNQIVDTIQYLKILKDYKALRIIVPKQCLQKAFELCQRISERLNWGLQKMPSEKEKEKQTVQLTLKEGAKIKIQQSQFKTLKGNSKKYFQDFQKKNKYKITNDFSMDEYLKGFKDHQKDIFKTYNKWVLKAQGDDIPKLLKFSWILKKDQSNNVEIKVGAVQQTPFALIQIMQGEYKQKRPKVDASIVNSILTN